MTDHSVVHAYEKDTRCKTFRFCFACGLALIPDTRTGGFDPETGKRLRVNDGGLICPNHRSVVLAKAARCGYCGQSHNPASVSINCRHCGAPRT